MHWHSVFRSNIRLAEQYRRVRVFLTGDGAHVHPPMGAQGLHTGIQDAWNLDWKMGQVLAGAPDALLDSYEAERRPIAATVLGLSTAKYAAADPARWPYRPDRGDRSSGHDHARGGVDDPSATMSGAAGWL